MLGLDLSYSHFEQNLVAPIHQLPNEIIASIFILGRLTSIGTGPIHRDFDLHRYPFLLGSVCQLWRQVARSLPQLWNYVLVRAPDSTSAMKFDREILCTVLELSRNLELCLSILPGRDRILSPLARQCFDDIIPHISRIFTLSVFVWDGELAIIPHQTHVELPNLQHFFVYKVRNFTFPFILPAWIGQSPLETFHYAPDPPGLFETNAVPTARLRDLYVSLQYVDGDVMDFIESSPLQFVHLSTEWWHAHTTLSSTTLTHVKICIDHVSSSSPSRIHRICSTSAYSACKSVLSRQMCHLCNGPISHHFCPCISPLAGRNTLLTPTSLTSWEKPHDLSPSTY